ncbi:hypothetical protein pb186bvf_017846 [Paramecium bursaria]
MFTFKLINPIRYTNNYYKISHDGFPFVTRLSQDQMIDFDQFKIRKKSNQTLFNLYELYIKNKQSSSTFNI